ncbi:hypothetical protein [Thermoflavimicrobium dichotomicum]|uniref:Heat induced stress protein YflT n=1 Tax=Thermoflavimicrobium dichotomicum TaxID=46223 RepID=A0A1I3T1D9_9BACL|nr:hypothetical protein [Thermoflavimicrobium dichotomicum]SFJ64463.1 hypothetical protein SAMN05421852_11516 [Thermoflavimicrobium dichotomicum]
MKERNIFAFFHTMDKAEAAANELKKRGFATVQVDRFSPLPGGGKDTDLDAEIHGILRRQANSLTTSTLGLPPVNNDLRVLATAHPDASGMADGSPFYHSEDICVTVITNEERYDEAYEILERYGAHF